MHAYLESLWYDVRYSARTLARNPGFAVVIVATLALSIGANSAIFSAINGVLFETLPYRQPDRLVRIFMESRSYPSFPMNPYDFRDFRARSRSFESLAAYTRGDVQLSGAGRPLKLVHFFVTAGYFGVLGVHPELGRDFDTADELPGKGHSIVLSDRLWRSRFGARRNILGQTILVNDLPLVVVGVMPAGFEHPGNEYQPVAYGDTVDTWMPFTFDEDPSHRGSHYMAVIGRLKKRVTPAQAEAELNAVMSQLAREHPGQDAGWRVTVVPLERQIVGRSERMLLVLLGAVGLVLLIACANAANLLLARATARQREIALRSALGAKRSRLVRQILTESVLIALLGAAFGIALAVAGVKALVSLLPADFPRAGDIHVNLAVFVFTLAIALAAGVLFGLAPALQVSRTDLQRALHESGRSATGSPGSVRLRNALVVSEVSLSCVLLIGAGLVLRSFVNLLGTNPGFHAQRVLTARISLPAHEYHTSELAIRFYHRLIANLQTVPGVQIAAAGTDLPWTGYDDNLGGWTIAGKTPPPHEEFHARYHVATSDYFRALGIPLIRGRFFTPHDNLNARNVLIINQSMARNYWGNENPLGARVTFADHPKEDDWFTVVGVVGDVKDAPNSKAAEPAFWWPLLQEPFPFTTMSIVLRSDTNPAILADQLRTAVWQLNSSLAVADIQLMDQVAEQSFSTPRFTLFLVVLFAALALTLAAVGTYGVISYSVTQRRHEFGVRMALGAQPRDVLGFVLGEGMRLALAGVALGVLCGLGFARLLGNLLYEVGAADPLTFLGVCVVVLSAAALACYLPAWRAMQSDPMTALRAE